MSDAADSREAPAAWATERVAQSQADSEQHPASPSLETLPAELRLRVLSALPDLKSLGSLIHASPVYFAQYRLDRKSLLSRCLEADLGREVLIDAIAAFNSTSSRIGPSAAPNSNVTDFIDLYGWWRHTRSPVAMLGSMSLADVRWITWNHTSTVRPLAVRFSSWTWTNLKSSVADLELEKSSEESHTPTPGVWLDDVSRTESRRILRALYRFQIFCNLFSGKQCQSFTWEEMYLIFFWQFDAWEVEEINCVYQWIEQRYNQVVAEVGWEFHPSNPKFADDPDFGFEPDGALTLERDADEYLAGTIGRGGLRFALHMTQTEGRAKLLELVHKYFRRSQPLCFFHDCMETHVQNERRWYWSTHHEACEKDLAEQRRDPMPFAGDGESLLLPTHAAATADTVLDGIRSNNEDLSEVLSTCGPPLAWVLLWDGKYCNLYGQYIPDKFRWWGYVLWDERRWNALPGARQLLLRAWQSSTEYQMVKSDFHWFRA